MKSKLLMLILAVAAVAGCQQDPKKNPTQKQMALKEWNQARASVMASLAKSQYESGNVDKAQQTLGDALKLVPDSAVLHVLSGKMYLEQGQLEQAEHELTTARKLDPKNADADYFSGVVYQRWDKPQEAFDFYGHAAEKNPNEIAYVIAQAEMLVAMQKPEEAVALLHSKMPTFEHNPVLHHTMGQILVDEGRYADAVKSLEQANILSGEDQAVQEHLAMAYYFNQQYREASGLFQRLLNDEKNAKRADLWLAQGECQLQLQQLGDARSSFDTATQLEPASATAWLNLGKAAVQLNDGRRAEIALRKAVALDAGSSDAHLMLGYLRMRQHRLPEALGEFQKASALDANDPVSLCMVGYVLEKSGKNEQAMKCYAQALKLKPNDELASKLMASIDLSSD
ncbi:MAG TPA: tetratricopeptide repeat protein [Tepidisphaeraceae bacterium]